MNQIKNTLRNRLRRDEPGPGYIHLSRNMDSRYFKELTAERKDGDDWVRSGANETWDLAVYALASYLRVRPWSFDFANRPPRFSIPKPIDDDGLELASGDGDQVVEDQVDEVGDDEADDEREPLLANTRNAPAGARRKRTKRTRRGPGRYKGRGSF